MLHDALAHALFGEDEPEAVNVPEQYKPPTGDSAEQVDSPRRPLAASAPPLSYSPRTGQQQKMPPPPPYDEFADQPLDTPHGDDDTQPTAREQVGFFVVWFLLPA